MDLGPSSTADAVLDGGLTENAWIQPVQDARVVPTDGDPAELAAARESIRLAFVAALQHLPPRQRAVLILREVLRWQATEVAELLDTTVASVNSALQRARATLDAVESDRVVSPPTDAEQQELLARYVNAFESYDMTSLVALLRHDVEFNMPPYQLWLQGPDQVEAWLLGQGFACKGSKLVPTSANGCPAFAQYKPSPDGGHAPWSIQVLEISDGQIVGWTNFLCQGPELFESFGLPPRL
jgi:RNA polymerase sigma-70 factor (ECF subfamily)